MVKKIDFDQLSSQSPLYVPPEIIERIINELKDDKSSLGRCSLVCRSWIFHTRHRLFHEVGFREPVYGLFNNEAQFGRLSRFIELCSNHHSTIPAAGIRVFELNQAQPAKPLIEAFQWLSTPINGDTNTNVTMADHIFWNLQHLKLKNTNSMNFDLLINHILQLQVFSKIGHLTMTSCHFKFQSISEDFTIDFPRTFRHLDISPVTGPSVWRSFPLSTLRTYSGFRELSIPLTSRTMSELEYILTRGAAAAIGSIKRCTIRIPGPRQALASANFQSLVKSLIINARIPEIVVEGSIFGVDKFMEWIYAEEAMGKPCHSQVTEIALNKVRNMSDGWLPETPILPRMDTVWATHPFFRSLKEIRADLVLSMGSIPGPRNIPRSPEENPAMKLQAEKFHELLPNCSDCGLLRPMVTIEGLGKF
ncbi:cytoplasmic protein [Moniliophthora roreri MCA 2997]|uniref:Cytoplasmic protein n=1 Tax=Moniliophthora roreri (strain MCA 2997) TaxID=1381753 RepID=V2X0G0_MONRO|nr:cytoplasmic protein [Moniliophthora roreri MCA 2997]